MVRNGGRSSARWCDTASPGKAPALGMGLVNLDKGKVRGYLATWKRLLEAASRRRLQDLPNSNKETSRARDCRQWPYGGESGIRTRGGLLTHTRFPGVRLKPLIHLSGILL